MDFKYNIVFFMDFQCNIFDFIAFSIAFYLIQKAFKLLRWIYKERRKSSKLHKKAEEAREQELNKIIALNCKHEVTDVNWFGKEDCLVCGKHLGYVDIMDNNRRLYEK